MTIQESLNQMLHSVSIAAGAKKYFKGQKQQLKATEAQTEQLKQSQETQAEYIKQLNKKLEEKQIEQAIEEQEYKEVEAEKAGYSSPEQQYRWEEEAEKEKIRKQLKGEEALSTLLERVDFLNSFNQSYKTRRSMLLDKSGNNLEVPYGKQ